MGIESQSERKDALETVGCLWKLYPKGESQLYKDPLDHKSKAAVIDGSKSDGAPHHKGWPILLRSPLRKPIAETVRVQRGLLYLCVGVTNGHFLFDHANDATAT